MCDLSGHPVVDRTVANVLQDFGFAGVRRYAKQHIRICFECMMTRNLRGKRPFETLHIDNVRRFITTPRGKRYIFTLVDNFTKCVIFYTVRDTSAAIVLECVEDFVRK